MNKMNVKLIRKNEDMTDPQKWITSEERNVWMHDPKEKIKIKNENPVHP